VRIQAITLHMASSRDAMQICEGSGENGCDLEASDDGQTFRNVVHIENGDVGTTTAFAPVTARFFRITFATKAPAPASVDVAELVLYTGARVNRFEDKAAFTTMDDLYGLATPTVPASEAIDKNSIVDLTSKMQPTAPWIGPRPRPLGRRAPGLLFARHSQSPATREATGLEVDKLDGRYVRHYMDTYLDTYEHTVGPDLMGKRGLRFIITDSWEAGPQTGLIT